MRYAFLLALWLVAALAACTQEAGALSRDVGGPCGGDEECNAESFCQEGSLYPDGMCAIDCENQEECILSTVCTVRGFCMMVCSQDSDCRDGYSCVPVERTNGLSDVKVCANEEPL
jgi:hypothetical protein